MVKIYQQPFAHAGTKQAIPDASDPQGFVSNEDGFTTDYELPDTDPNYKPIERAEFNGLMNMVTEALGELQQFGFAKWQAGTWPKDARVVKDGVVYRALNQTSQQPPHADWANDMAALDTKAEKSTQVTAGTGLSGGGNLSANRTLSVVYGTTAGTAAQGNDSRINNGQTAFGWGNHASAGYVQTSGNQTVAGTKTFTSFPVTPSAAPTASYQVANKKYVDDKAASSGLGVGQTWQDVTLSRVADTIYTNATGKPIEVFIALSSIDGNADSIRVSPNGTEWITVGSGDSHVMKISSQFTVPSGWKYKSTVFIRWAELR